MSPRRSNGCAPICLSADRRLDATLVSVLAYAGLRPARRSGCAGTTSASEPCWSSARSRSGSSSRPRPPAPVPSAARALKEDLLNWRAHTSRGKDLDLIFASPDGSPWNDDRVRNWRKREFAEAAEHAEVRTRAAV